MQSLSPCGARALSHASAGSQLGVQRSAGGPAAAPAVPAQRRRRAAGRLLVEARATTRDGRGGAAARSKARVPARACVCAARVTLLRNDG
jgi:hypothetical protein